MALTDLEQQILANERRVWKYAAAKEAAILRELGLSSTRYYQLLAALLDRPDALAYDAVTVRRLQRLREARRVQRTASRLAG